MIIREETWKLVERWRALKRTYWPIRVRVRALSDEGWKQVDQEVIRGDSIEISDKTHKTKIKIDIE